MLLCQTPPTRSSPIGATCDLEWPKDGATDIPGQGCVIDRWVDWKCGRTVSIVSGDLGTFLLLVLLCTMDPLLLSCSGSGYLERHFSFYISLSSSKSLEVIFKPQKGVSVLVPVPVRSTAVQQQTGDVSLRTIPRGLPVRYACAFSLTVSLSVSLSDTRVSGCTTT